MSILPRASAPVAPTPATPACPAQLLGPHQRQEMALHALAGTRPVTQLACIRRRRPYGDDAWAEGAARQLGLGASLRPRGRPRKRAADSPSLFGHLTDPQ